MKTLKHIFQLNLSAKEAVWSKRVMAIVMLPIFMFYMTSMNFLVMGVMTASAADESAIVKVATDLVPKAPAEEPADVKEIVAPVKEVVAPAEEPVPVVEEEAPAPAPEKLVVEPAPVVEVVEPVIEPIVETQPTSGVITPEAASTEAVVADPIAEVVPVETVTVTEEVPVVAPEWQVSADGKIEKIGPVVVGTTYVAPQNSEVTVTFTKLPENPGKLSIEEITLTPEQIASLGALSDKAYDITSDMADGTFAYDLTLPKPANQENVEIKFAEDVAGLKDADTVASGDVTTETDSVSTNLDHFTTFVVTKNPTSDCTSGVYAAGVCYATIQAAIDNALTHNGDTINVAAGAYNENIHLNKAVNLVGASKSTTTISNNGGAVITIDSVTGPMTISGFTIDALNTASEVGIAIQATSSSITIEQNNIVNFTERGIVISNSNSNTIKNNTINGSSSGSNAGVYVDNNSANNIIGGVNAGDGNTILLATSGSGNLYGVLLSGSISGNNTVQNNTINGGMRAVQQDSSVSGTTTISDNKIGATTSPIYGGIVLAGGSATISGNTLTNAVRPIEIQNAVNLTITSNIIASSTYSGINLAAYSGTASVSGNTVHGLANSNGIWAQTNGAGLTISSNTIYDITGTGGPNWGGRGIQIDASAKNANIDGNEIYNVTGFAGIVIDTDATGVKINNNHIHNNEQGVVANEQTAEFKNNRILNNRWGIDLNKTGATFILLNNSIANNNTNPADSHGLSVWAGTAIAISNWWGNATGPGDVGHGTGDKVSTNVTYNPWYNTDAKTTKTYQVGAGETYTTIESAIDAALDGDTINVAVGTYAENLTVNKSLTIKGVGDTTIINGAIVSGGDNVTIQDLKIITPGGVNYNEWYWGIRATANNTLTLNNVTIDVSDGYSNNNFYGIRMGFEEVSTGAVININNSRIKGYGAIYLNGSAEGGSLVQTGTHINVTDSTLTGMTSHSGFSDDFAVIAIDNTTGVNIDFTGASRVASEYTNSAQAKQRLIRFRNASGTTVTGSPTYTNGAGSTVNTNALFMSYGSDTNAVNGEVIARWITNTAEFEAALLSDVTTPIVVGRYETTYKPLENPSWLLEPIETTKNNTLKTGVKLIIEDHNLVTISGGNTLVNNGTIIIEPDVTFTNNGIIRGSGTISGTVGGSGITDITAPVLTITSPIAGQVTGHTLNIEGTASDLNFNYYYCYVSGTSGEVGVRDAQCITAWSAGSPFHSAFAQTATGTTNGHLGSINLTGVADGTYTVHLVAKDNVGNSAETTQSFILDNTAPNANITSPSVGGYVRGTIDITGAFSDNNHEFSSIYMGFIGNDKNGTPLSWCHSEAPGLGITDGTRTCSFDTTKLSDGSHKIEIWAKDKAGNWGTGLSKSIDVMVDNTAPTDPVTPVSTPNPTNSFTQDWAWFASTDIGGSGVEGYYQKIYDVLHSTIFSDWSWIDNVLGISTSLTDGQWQLQLQAEDNAGNKSGEVSSATLTVDSVAPDKPSATLSAGGVNVPANGYTNSKTFTFSLSSAGATRYQLKYWNDISGSRYKKSAPWNSTNLSATYPDNFTQGEGKHYLAFSACDAANNCSDYADPFIVTYDKTAPVVHLTAPTTSLVSGTVAIEGTVTDANPHHYWLAIYKKSDNSEVYSTVVNHSDQVADRLLYSWDTTETGINDGEYQIKFAEKDAAGNRSSDFVTEVTVDNTAPTLSDKTDFGSSWYNSAQTSVFNYSDANMADGYVAPTCDITTEGTNQTCSITPNICDKAGNCNTATVVSNGANIDKTDPGSTITTPSDAVSGSTVYLKDWDGSIAGAAADVLSGVNDVQISIQKGSTQYFNESMFVDSETEILLDATYTAGNWEYSGLTLPVDGRYTIKSHAIDNATNVENTYTLIIILDKTIPEVTLAIDPVNPEGDNSWYLTNPTVTLTANDNFDADRIEYQLDSTGGSWLTYNGPIKLDDGNWKFYYRSFDKAGNISGEGLKNVKVDTTDPDNVNSFQAEYRPGTAAVRLTWNVNDNDTKEVYIYRGGSRNFTVNSSSRIVINDNNDEVYTDNNVTLGETYFYKAVARDDAGNNSSASVIKIVIPSGGTAPAVSTALGTEVVPEGTILGTETSTEGQPTVTEEPQGTEVDNAKPEVLGEDVQKSNQPLWSKWWFWLILLGVFSLPVWLLFKNKPTE